MENNTQNTKPRIKVEIIIDYQAAPLQEKVNKFLEEKIRKPNINIEMMQFTETKRGYSCYIVYEEQDVVM